MRKRLSPGAVLGLIAVVFAMSGSAYAASKITSAQIKDGTIVAKDIRDSAITADKLSNNAMQALAGDTGPQGPAGPAGPAGPQGPAGPSAVAQITKVSSGNVSFAYNSYAQGATAYCPAGQRVVSGGGASISGSGLVASEPNAARNGWFVVGGSTFFDATQYVEAVAFCAPGGVAVAASADHRRDAAALRALVRKTSARFAALGR